MRTTADVERALRDLLDCDRDGDWSELDATLRDVRTFADAGLLTRDRGLVLRFASGLEIQLAIVRSANPNEEEASGGNADAEAVADMYRHALRSHR